MAYPMHRSQAVPASPDLPGIESDVLAYWQADDTFQASIDQRPAGENGSNEFVFYDGPPFANGLPHYGHLLTGYAKDVVPRYQTMRGRKVERRFGWDTHGLPAELSAEEDLGITDKSQIEEMGIAKFNEACRTSVLRYSQEWEEYVTRQARWVDFENDYKTFDVTFMESVIWAFKQLYDKGLAYEGYRVLPYCWRDETPLSNHELRMDDDVYASRQDPSLTVGLRLETGELVLVWTTTPWTLPSNLALAVGPDVDYVAVTPEAGSPFAETHPDEQVILARALLGAYARELGEEPQIVKTMKGSDLVGLSYSPPFAYFAGHENAHRVLAGDFVSTEDGTGIVHLAPAFGEEDMEVCAAADIQPVVPVNSKGQFTTEVPDYASVQVFEANRAIIADLKNATGPIAEITSDQRPVVLRHETYEHSYPHCWRCRNPLIYKAVSSWFVRVTEFKDRMVELNEEISWTPEHIKHGQFGKWLENARDWSISRNRYWGTPIPVWVSDNPEYPRIDVYGSLAEIKADFGRLPLNGAGDPDLHRPYIDELTRPNPDDPTGQSTMRRITDVLDVWFDSGAMPFAQVHYPFDNSDWFEHHYPGDFIVEYIGQTRGWFYTLHILATALFDRPAFRTCISHGIVLGNDGRKASKSLRNYPDPMEMFNKYGSDAVRWSLMSSPVLRGGNLVVAEESIRDGVRQVLLPLWSTYYFFSLYADAANGGKGLTTKGVNADTELAQMDRYVLARTRVLVEKVTADMDAYDITGASAAVREHLDLLTNWYVRTQRDRFWNEDQAAFDTLYTSLEILTRVMAPLAPMITEEVWRGLTGGRSIHLTDWPSVAPGGAEAAVLAPDVELVTAMDTVREVCTAALGLRKAHQIRVRQPLGRVRVALPEPERAADLRDLSDLIAHEVNLKEVDVLVLDEESYGDLGVEKRLAVNARAAGPRLGKDVQTVIRAAKAGDWELRPGAGADGADQAIVGGVELLSNEFTTTLTVREQDSAELAATTLPGGGIVLLDLAINDELRAEGYARDVVRAIQEERRATNLDVSDRIRAWVEVPGDQAAGVEAHRNFIAAETLALELTIEVAPTQDTHVRVEKIDS